MRTVDDIIEETIGHEGGYSDHPSDPGGATRWGITQRTARANAYMGDMRELPRDFAKAIYKTEYYVKPGFAAVATLSSAIAAELFDTGVNVGPGRPAIWFQEWLNAFNAQGKLYGDIAEDGRIGNGTIGALASYLKKRGPEAEAVMVRALNCSQGAYYGAIIAKRAANEDFAYGWMRTRVA